MFKTCPLLVCVGVAANTFKCGRPGIVFPETKLIVKSCVVDWCHKFLLNPVNYSLVWSILHISTPINGKNILFLFIVFDHIMRLKDF